jgi:hypothetical protein
MRLKAQGNGFEVLTIDEKDVSLGSALVTTNNNDLFISFGLRDGKVLSNGKFLRPPIRSKAPLSGYEARLTGYIVFFIDRINDDEIKITHIDYEKLFARLEANKRVGTDLCRKVPLFAQEVRRQMVPVPVCQEPSSEAQDLGVPDSGTPDPPKTVDSHAGVCAVSFGDDGLCYLLATNAVVRSGGGSRLERSNDSDEYYRVKTVGSSGAN